MDQRRINSGNKAAEEAQEIWACVVNYYKIPIPRINEAMDTDLKGIERLQQIGWKRGVTLLYQQEYALSPEHQKMFDDKKSIKPDITLTDISGIY